MDTTVLGFNLEELSNLKALATASEINQQPKVWRNIWERVYEQRKEIKEFLDNALKTTDSIILTGAGTSAFIGLSLKGVFDRKLNKITEPISTTHLVSHPTDYLSPNRTVLLVSFARSGDSPESMAAVELADKYSKNCIHLIITCNPNGQLAKGKTKNKKFVFLLPKETLDKSLAMTSSYSGMLLAGILIARINEISSLKTQVAILADYGQQILNKANVLKEIASLDFKRAVFLGSGPLYGTAKESHLKLQELSAGIVICKHDSYLGFRHGPKIVTDDTSIVVYLFSNKEYVSKYEKDLVSSMGKDNKAMFELGIMESTIPGMELDCTISFIPSATLIEEEFLSICSVIPAQLLGFYKSIHLGLSPDNPSDSGVISRVVTGVKIYEAN